MKILRMTGNRQYDRYVSRFNRWNQTRRITPARLQKYFEYLKEQKYSTSTLRLNRAAIKCALEGNLVSRRQFEQLTQFTFFFKRVKFIVHPRPVEVVTEPEMKELLRHLRREPKNAALILAFWHTGGRISEVLAIRHRDCIADIKRKMVTARVPGKGGKTVDLDLPIDVYKTIVKEWKSVNYLFEGKKTGTALNPRAVQVFVSRLGRRILARRVTPHTFRHSAATRLYEKGQSIKSIQGFLHHSSAKTTLDIYVHKKENKNSIQADLNLAIKPQARAQKTRKADASKLRKAK